MILPDFRTPATGAIVNSFPASVKKDAEMTAKKGGKRENAAGENYLNRALAAAS